MEVWIFNRIERKMTDYKNWLKDKEIVLINREKHRKDYSDFDKQITFKDFTFPSFHFLQERIKEKQMCGEDIYLVSTSERDLLPLSELRTEYNLYGQKFKEAELFRNKVEMKKKLKSIVKIPEFKEIESFLDIQKFIDKYDYPVVIKPISGAGSLNTHIIDSKEKLYEVLGNGLDKDMMIEKFINGDMYHVDGIYQNGELLISRPSVYINGCLAYQENKFLGSVMLDYAHPLFDRLNDEALKILDKLSSSEQAIVYHLELFHTNEDEIVFCEIASRVGGGRINDCFEKVTGVNLIGEWVKSQCNLPVRVKDENNKLAGWILIPPPKAGRIKKLEDIGYPEGMFFKDYYLHEGDYTNNPKISIECVVAMAVEGNSTNEIVAKLDKCNELFLSSIVIEEEITNED
ncbi:acetyl-CoA carboxylase biotin carboxylase subunit family protein [Robertmurraya beringensis]|uniref:Acetyl-CoA carboxylase biotin carboxylase subunit family protein n=1 Tax=Robertmurraya beringensis TaxID=641660 RepID=A0ABV6KY47_9BACI